MYIIVLIFKLEGYVFAGTHDASTSLGRSNHIMFTNPTCSLPVGKSSSTEWPCCWANSLSSDRFVLGQVSVSCCRDRLVGLDVALSAVAVEVVMQDNWKWSLMLIGLGSSNKQVNFIIWAETALLFDQRSDLTYRELSHAFFLSFSHRFLWSRREIKNNNLYVCNVIMLHFFQIKVVSFYKFYLRDAEFSLKITSVWVGT